MIGRYIDGLVNWMKRVVTQPREELDRWQQAARFGYDLGRFGARQLKHDRAAQMASALAFRALFGLVPVLIVVTILVRAVIGIDEFLGLINELLVWASLDQVMIIGPAGVGSQTLAQWLEGLIGEAASINLTAIGWVGLVVVIYAAIGLMTTIENAFNTVYRAHEGRPWTRRVPLYWFLLTVSPIAIGLAAWLNGQFSQLQASIDGPWLVSLVSVLWSCLFGWALMLAIYMLVPNAPVKFRPAAVGALVAVIIIEIGKRVLGATLANAFSISQLYGSLGLIPLFMFWTYLMWLAVLFGLQVSATLQLLHGRRLEEFERRREVMGLVEPGALITVMEMIARRFADGRPTTPEDLSEQLGIRRDVVREILESLQQAQLVHRVSGDSEAVCLARPADQIAAAELIEIGFAMIDESGGHQSRLLERLRDAQRRFAGQQTLASLLGSTPAT